MSLYARLVVGFLMAVAATLATQLIFLALQPDSRFAPRLMLVGSDLVHAQGETALTRWNREGAESGRHAMDSIAATGLDAWIVRGKDVLGARPIPNDLLRDAHQGPSKSIGLWIQPLAENGALLVVSTPRVSVAMQVARFLLLLLVPGTVCLVFARRLARPIEQLHDTATGLGGGDLTRRVGQLRSYREAQDLARAFDAMADRIQLLVESQARMLADVSHEVRSPLARIRLATEMLETGDVAKNRARIQRDVARIDELIEALATVVRADHVPLSVEPFELSALVTEILDAASPEAEHLNLRFEKRTEPLELRADRRLVHSAIENLVRNALVHAPAGSVIEVTQQDAYVTVEDRGPGVPEDRLETIFEPFFRLDEARERPAGGTGLGLSIVKRAAQLHGGQATAFNREGGGLAVRVLFTS